MSPVQSRPRILIQPQARWQWLDLSELWRYRELLLFLAWRDIMVRYKQTALGAAWAILQPVASMVVFTLFFGRLAKMPSDGQPYAMFNLCATVPWTFFANAINTSSTSVVAGADLVKKVYFPRLIIPGAAVLAGTVDFAIATVVLVVMLLGYRITPTSHLLLFPLLVLITLGVALGVGTWLAAVNVKYRDVRYAVPFMVQLWMFATPIVYPLSIVPDKYRLLMALNPMTGTIEGFRACFLGNPIPWTPLTMSFAAALMLLLTGGLYFQRVEREFADII